MQDLGRRRVLWFAGGGLIVLVAAGFLLLRPSAPVDALDRFEQVFKETPEYSVNVEVVSAPSGRKIEAKLSARKFDQLVYDAKGGGVDYRAVVAKDRVYEVEHNNKRYDVLPREDRLPIPALSLSEDPLKFFPYPLVMGSLRFLAPRDAKWSTDGTELIDGVICDRLNTEYSSDFGSNKVEIAVGKDGWVRRYKTSSNESGRWESETFTFTGYDFKANPDAHYGWTLPDGYLPVSTDRGDGNYNSPGEPFELGIWRQGGRTQDMGEAMKGKRSLFFVVAENCEPSRAMKPILESVSQQIRQSGGFAATLSLDGVPVGFPEAWTAEREETLKLRIAATPAVYLVSPRGGVERLWVGFDATQADAMRSDMLEALKGNGQE